MKVYVVGAGAAGMMAAIRAAEMGHNVTVLERNEKSGKKIYITGKGRCNLTNACDSDQLLANIVSNPKFMMSAFSAFNNHDLMKMFEDEGLEIKVERGNRVFPVSDHSSDVIRTLDKMMRDRGVKLEYNTLVTGVETESYSCEEDKKVQARLVAIKVLDSSKKEKRLEADVVIFACGGKSYQVTGSDGLGLQIAEKLGLKVTATRPALVPISFKEDYIRELEGLSLKNVGVSVKDGKKELYSGFGELVYTADGMSGPLILSCSSKIGKKLEEKELILHLDMKPSLSYDQLDQRILRDFKDEMNKDFRNSIDSLLPRKMIPIVIKLSGIAPDKKVNLITHEERLRLVSLIKDMQYTCVKLHDFREAIITQGGISVKGIDPKTMRAKKIKGLYFAGEMLDIDAFTGGFNLQVAWSTGYAAGSYLE